MTWVRLDDTFADDPLMDRAGAAAAWLHVAGLCYSNRHLTDGFIPAERVRRLTASGDVDEQLAELVGLGVWQLDAGGYRIVHHLEHQFTREQVLLERKKTAERVRLHRQRAASRNAVTDGVSNAAPTRPVKTGRARARPTDPAPRQPKPRCIAPDCVDGWIGDDEHGRPRPCPTCRPTAARRSA